MYKYKNIKTGVVVLVESKVGGDWVLVEEKQSPSIKEEKPIEEVKIEKTKPVKKEVKKTKKNKK